MSGRAVAAWCYVSVFLATVAVAAQASGPDAPVTFVAQSLPVNGAAREVAVSLSGDGRFVAFESRAALVPEDSNDAADIYLLDRDTNDLTLVSRASDGSPANGDSAVPRISTDGRFVAFDSVASRLVPGDVNEHIDVFVWDRLTRTMKRISVSNLGGEGNGSSRRPAISANGQVVAFQSTATNLVEGHDANGKVPDVYLYRTEFHRVSRVSVAADGRQLTRGSHFDVALSGNGRAIAFTSTADLGCPLATSETRHLGDSVASMNVYIKDLATGHLACVSYAADGHAANGRSFQAAIDDSGRRVAYITDATNLADRDRNSETDVVLRDVPSGKLTFISRAANGRSANGPSRHPVMSGSGRFVAFVSTASDLLCHRRCSPLQQDLNLVADVYLFDSVSATMRRLSTDGEGEWWSASRGPALDSTATVVAFSSSQPVSTHDLSGDEDLFILTLAPARPF